MALGLLTLAAIFVGIQGASAALNPNTFKCGCTGVGIIEQALHWTRRVVGWSVCPRSTQRSVRLGRASFYHA